MRPALPEIAAANITTTTQLSPPPPHARATSCDPQAHSCKWWPYSNSSDFGANTAMIIIVLLCALICALALNTAIRWFFRSSNNTSDHLRQAQREIEEQRKADLEAGAKQLAVAPTVVYSAGMKLAGAEVDCAICLSEFMEGEEIRVMGRCNHGFHVHCIEKWLSEHSSCPTCRRSCLASFSPSLPEPVNCCSGNGLNNISQSAPPETAPQNPTRNENVTV